MQSYVNSQRQTNFPKLPSNFNIWHRKEKEGGGGEKHCVMMIKTIRYAKKKIGARISTIHSFHKRQFFTFLEIPQKHPTRLPYLRCKWLSLNGKYSSKVQKCQYYNINKYFTILFTKHLYLPTYKIWNIVSSLKNKTAYHLKCVKIITVFFYYPMY